MDAVDAWLGKLFGNIRQSDTIGFFPNQIFPLPLLIEHYPVVRTDAKDTYLTRSPKQSKVHTNTAFVTFVKAPLLVRLIQ